jgi:hypothetical protein
MAMFLDKYLTEYDDSLSGESYIDPLGMLIIWSAYGQEIFNNRVNSISNDVRNYTLNLFNHYLVRRLIQDESVLLSKRLTDVYGGKDTLFFKYACLLYLENLFVFSILQHDGSKGVESSGVLGISNGRRRWNEADGNPRLVFSHDKPGQILVRQLGLGVSGRYKTPLLEIGYFDGNYHYHQPSAETLWQGAENFIVGNKSLHALAELLVEHMQELLSQNSRQPETQFSTIPKELPSAYADAFASSGAVGKYARDYWLSVTALDTGASGALLKVLDENAKSQSPTDLTPQELMRLAMTKSLSEHELSKMKHIEWLEPFLADAMLLFTLLSHTKSQPLQAVSERWKAFGRDEQTLPRRAQGLRDDPILLGVVKGAAGARLNALLQLADATTLSDQIRLLVDYHGRVMVERGQQPWLALDDKGIKVHVRPMRDPSEDEWPQGAWYHSYYLPQFKSLVRGYQGVTA